jgi:ATP-dependent Clp protease ATP-binding subunit ClpB/ATP-dependent Clp protease ATP-binding subunit ClpC
MTTNAGSTGSAAALGFTASAKEAEKNKTEKALLGFLRPEFVNRVDEVITFSALSRENFTEIAAIMLSDLAGVLRDKGIDMTFTRPAAELVAESSYSVKYGARNLRRTIQTEIEDKASELIISSYDSKISGVSAFVEDGEIKVIVKK